MAQLTMIQAINQALAQALDQDPAVIVFGEDVGKNGGVFRATDQLQARFGEQRVVDTPLSESAIIGSAIGLAVNGMKPVAEIQFMGFLYPAMDQLASQASRLRFRSAGRYALPLVVRAPFGGGVRTPELHADSLEALFTHTPGLKVVIPSSAYDAKGLLLQAIDDPDPVLFAEPMKLYRAIKEEVPEEPYHIPLGQARVVREGKDVTVLTWGAPVLLVHKLAGQLQQEQGISLEVIDLRSLIPLDEETIMHSVSKTGRALVVHEAVKTGGFGAELASRIMEQVFLYLQAPVMRVTGYDTPYPVPQVEDEWLPHEERILQAVHELLDY
ncbi:Transketolase central region [Caldalkalibacillus thermarum TA2.A1]|uniref:Alpha-ketoacid dehydrogenase subunit beta n=1 Tax=Caldalkalibacillus thermarum (strain TA2.A1) TaxID=986075 RepID=F5L5S6_CALTT|nr:alpha-ketoacid dehydrogenase subunit beta [Caldalkalibacillus thermarum]EGL83318.1 Transketolase central region [Caldalkalibacillus thermarum TA2.A1]QZT34088.1 alpha-ketoacid dehydrogenase subunit beta [Caldalkalibacillus thermarum TA2.A1]